MTTSDPHTNPDPLHLQLARSLDGREETRQDPLLGFLASYKSAVQLRSGKLERGAGGVGFVTEETGERPGMQLITGDDTTYGASSDTEASRRMWSVIDAGMGASAVADSRTTGGYDMAVPDSSASPLKRTRESLFTPYLRVAAVLAVMLLGGLLLYTKVRPDETLLASATDAIENYTLPDGSVLTLRPNSAVYASRSDSYALRLEGEARFTVTKNPDRVFSVTTTDALIEVTGTRFVVRSTGMETEVFLEEGGVRVSALASGEQQVLQPRQALRVGERGSSHIELPRAEYYLLWTRNEMLLDGRSLRDVADELERHFGIRVVLGAALADETLDGQIVLDEPGRILQDIALLLGAQLEIADNTYLLN